MRPFTRQSTPNTTPQDPSSGRSPAKTRRPSSRRKLTKKLGIAKRPGKPTPPSNHSKPSYSSFYLSRSPTHFLSRSHTPTHSVTHSLYSISSTYFGKGKTFRFLIFRFLPFRAIPNFSSKVRINSRRRANASPLRRTGNFFTTGTGIASA